MDTQQSDPSLRAVFTILDAWELSEPEQQVILGLAKEEYAQLRTGQRRVALNNELAERSSLILGIYKNLQILLPDPGAADSWVRRANDAPLFKGKPPRDYLLTGKMDDLYMIRHYLDAMSYGNF